MSKLIEGFNNRAKIKQLGDAILIVTTTLSGAVMGLPIKVEYQLWINFGLTVIGTVGKVLTNVIHNNNETK